MGDPSRERAIPLPQWPNYPSSPTPWTFLHPWWLWLSQTASDLLILFGWSWPSPPQAPSLGVLYFFNNTPSLHLFPSPCCQLLTTTVTTVLVCLGLCISGMLWRWPLPVLLFPLFSLAIHGSRTSKGTSVKKKDITIKRFINRGKNSIFFVFQYCGLNLGL
jgi:hypothetical protein